MGDERHDDRRGERHDDKRDERHGDHRVLEAIEDSKNAILKAAHKHDQWVRQANSASDKLLKHILAELERIQTPIRITVVACGHTIFFPNLTKEHEMYTLPRDHADEPYSLAPVTVGDSEGEVLGSITEEFVSSDPSVVMINATDATSGTVTFGTNGVADLRRNVSFDGLIVFSEAANFTITPGQIIASGGGISFPGLTPDAEPEPVPEG